MEQNTRDKLILAKIMLNNMYLFKAGLCVLLKKLRTKGLINSREVYYMIAVLHMEFVNTTGIDNAGCYWWERDNKRVRVKFLLNFIIKHEENRLKRTIYRGYRAFYKIW